MCTTHSIPGWGRGLLLLLILTGLAHYAGAQTGKNSIELSKFIDRLSKEKGWKLLYSPDDIDNKYVDLSSAGPTRDWDIAKLSAFLKKYNLQLQKTGESVYYLKTFVAVPEKAPQKSSGRDKRLLRGRVLDTKEPSGPIAGVSVAIKGVASGATTDAEGYFEMNVGEGDQLVFSSVGYKTKEYVVTANQASMIISLEESANAMNTVVVTGYSQQKAKYLASSVSTINTDNANNKPVTQLSQALQGGATGVYVNQSSGLPGSDVASVTIRGIGSFQGTNPLVLVDGMPMDLNLIDYSTVENITVLKDAAAASIYGARAGNGVILITTKRGVAGKPVVQYNSWAGLQVPTYRPHFVNAPTYMRLLNEAQQNVGGDVLYSPSAIAITASHLDPINYPDTRWSDVLRSTAPIHQQSLSVSGGNSAARFALTANYTSQDGILTNTKFNRASIRANTSIDLRKNIVVFMDMLVTRTQQTVPYSAGLTGSSGAVSGVSQVLGWIYTAPPTIIKKYPNKSVRPGYTYYGTYGESWNPVAQLERGGTAQSINDQSALNLRPKWTIIPGLDLKGQFSYQVTSGVSKQNRDAYIFYDYFTDQPTGRAYSDVKTAGPTNRAGYYYLGANMDYTRSFGMHRINALAGYSQELTNSDAWTEIALRSVFGKVYYSYRNKYLMELGIRGDGSSLFAPGKRWGTFPSAAIGWNLAGEDFMRDISFLNQLKLRASYGMLGNNSISPYLYQSTINTADGREATNANPDITWERVGILDIGANITLFRKLDITLDYYDKKTTRMILYPQPSLASALISGPANVGSMQNRGAEMAASYGATITKHLMFNISGGVSYNKTKILKLAANPLISDHYIYREGGEMAEFYGYKSTGLLQQKDIAAGVPMLAGQVAGDIAYEDRNGDTRISDSDRVSLGNSIPRLNYYTNLTIFLGNFDLSTLVNGVGKVGLEYTSRIANPLNTAGNGGTPQQFQLDYWTPEHTNANRPRLTPTPGNNGLTSSFWIKNGAFARIRYLALGYTFKLKPTSSIKKLRVYINAQNPFTFSGVKVIDPESRGAEGTYPIMRVYTFGINLSL